jgi:tRNA-binding protein
MATIEDFQKLDIRVGKILEVEDAETRKPMYKLKVDFGDLGTKQCIAGIKPWYEKEELLNRKAIFVVNFEPKRIGNVLSECMVLTAEKDNKVFILIPEKDIEVGAKIH